MAATPKNEPDKRARPPQPPNIDEALREAASRGRTPEEKFEQRVSWAYGQYPDGSMSKDDVRELLKNS